MASNGRMGKPGSRAPKRVRTRPVPQWVWKLLEVVGRIVITALSRYRS